MGDELKLYNFLNKGPAESVSQKLVTNVSKSLREEPVIKENLISKN